MRLTTAIRAEADVTHYLTVEEAAQLPGLLGKTVSAHLRYNGWRACTVDGVKTLYVLKPPPYAVRKALREATLAVGRAS